MSFYKNGFFFQSICWKTYGYPQRSIYKSYFIHNLCKFWKLLLCMNMLTQVRFKTKCRQREANLQPAEYFSNFFIFRLCYNTIWLKKVLNDKKKPNDMHKKVLALACRGSRCLKLLFGWWGESILVRCVRGLDPLLRSVKWGVVGEK